MTRKTQRKRPPSAQVVELALADTLIDALVQGYKQRMEVPSGLTLARAILAKFTVEIRREAE